MAESDAGQVTRVNPETGVTDVIFTGLSSPAGVARTRTGLAAVTGGAEVPDAAISGDSTVYFDFNGIGGDDPTPVADLEAYELENNPDGQLQFDPDDGEPLDALSNPFAAAPLGDTSDILVADGGANTVLRVSPYGEVSTFFTPPTVNTGACAGRPNNSPATPGCDAVPTGVANGPDGNIYISALTGEAPGEGRIYVLDQSGDLVDTITGLDSPTGVAVGDDGTIYASEVLYNLPEGDGPPPADFDPSSVGRIVRISPDGDRSYAAVTMPTGLLFFKGTLYSTAWSVAGLFLQIPDAGQIVAVGDSAFS